MKPYTYLMVDFLTIIVCFVFSFDRRIRFYLHFPAFLKAAAIVAIPFIIWDIYFTRNAVWWFNTDYTIGKIILGLPVEEWLFFFCIPFSCVFTFFCLDKFLKLDWANAFNNVIAFITIVGGAVLALIFKDRSYTFLTAATAVFAMIFLHFIARAQWTGKASLVFLILMLGFLPVNGILTGTGLDSPIVNYNPEEFLNIRLLSIPLEDAVYGYVQFLMVIYFFKFFQRPAGLHEQAIL